MAPRTKAVAIALTSAGLMAAGIAAFVAVLAAGHAGERTGGWALLGFLPPVAAFVAVGGLIAARHPRNAIGWLLGGIGLVFSIVVAASGASVWMLEETDATAAGEWLGVLGNAWVVALGLIGTQLPLRLPDGRLPSVGWRWYSRATLLLIAVSAVGMAVQPGPVDDVAGTENPLGSESLSPLSAAFLLVVLSFAGGLAALVGRYRRAGAPDRVQLRWVALGGAAFGAVYVVVTPLPGLAGLDEESWATTAIRMVAQAAFAALPVSIGYAILRHRLYDIDVVVNRALVYGALTATLAGVYAGSVLLLQLVLSPSSDVAVAVSTLAVAALFRPARVRIQAAVDRRFYRRKYDAQRTLAAFAARLREQVALDALEADLRRVVAEAMQPSHVSLWLRNRAGGAGYSLLNDGQQGDPDVRRRRAPREDLPPGPP